MPSDVRETPAAAMREAPASALDLVYACAFVGAGLIAVAVLVYGLMTQAESSGATLWTLAGLIAYLAVWVWGMRLAKNA